MLVIPAKTNKEKIKQFHIVVIKDKKEMTLSSKGEQFIKGFEKLCLTTYLCPAGKLTIGYGHTGPDVKKGMKITLPQAESLFKSDVAKVIQVINKQVKVPLKQGQFDALVSLAFNAGIGLLYKSTLMNMLNAGNYLGAGQQILRWDKETVNGVVQESPGLLRRRNGELDMWKN